VTALLLVDVFVPGRPRTKGSLDERHQDSQQSKHWRGLVAYAAGADFRRRFPPEVRPTTGPILVMQRFDYVEDDVTKITIGDIDKLSRNTLDALAPPTKTGSGASVYANDSQVVVMPAMKLGGCAAQGLKLAVWSIDPFFSAYVQSQIASTVFAAIASAGGSPWGH
jgi:hypothetical protein